MNSFFIYIRNNRKLPNVILICLPLLLLFGCSIAYASGYITGDYVSAEGKTIILHLNIKSNSPVNIIVEQYLSPGNKIIGTRPQASKVDQNGEKVKWLFRNVKSGKKEVTIKLGSSLKGNVSAMIRYRNRQSGEFTELFVAP